MLDVSRRMRVKIVRTQKSWLNNFRFLFASVWLVGLFPHWDRADSAKIMCRASFYA